MLDSGQLADSLTGYSFTYDGTAVGYQGSAGNVTANWYGPANTVLRVDTGPQINWGTGPPVVLSGTAPAGSTRLILRLNVAFDQTGSFVTTSGTCTLNGSFNGTGTPTVCEYGVEKNPSATVYTTVTAFLIDAAIVLLGGGPLAIAAFDAMLGAPLFPGAVCIAGPPAMPAFGPEDYIPGTQIWAPGSFDKRLQVLRVVAWSFYCRCVAAPSGFPAPTQPPPPLPFPDFGSTTGTPVPIICDGTDICTIFEQLMRQMTALAQELAYARRDIQLIQRQHVPFAYVPGTLHSGLSGAGTITVNPLLGLAVQSTTIPSYLSSDMAPVQSWFKLGELSWGTGDGWTARHIVTHNPHLFLDIGGDITEVAYLFEPGVVANILELIREP
jgi:hypothetical protein